MRAYRRSSNRYRLDIPIRMILEQSDAAKTASASGASAATSQRQVRMHLLVLHKPLMPTVARRNAYCYRSRHLAVIEPLVRWLDQYQTFASGLNDNHQSLDCLREKSFLWSSQGGALKFVFLLV